VLSARPADPKDDDQPDRVVDRVDDPERSDAQSPEVGTREPYHARRARLDREGEDGSAEPSRVPRR
jgi:hypothetical protein